jgi:trans-2-enoyl-CoA reductase
VVRRPNLIGHLGTFGAEVTLVDGPDLRDEVAQAVSGGSIKLGIDAIAGDATRRMGNCVADGGTVVNYGLLSGKPCEVDAADIVFRDISLKGFWYSRWFSTADPAAIKAVFAPWWACCWPRRCACRWRRPIRSSDLAKRWRTRSARGASAR